MQHDDDALKRHIAKLSPRERSCLRLVPELRTSKAIGKHLGLRPDTVGGYLKEAMRKLEVSDRYAAAKLLRIAEQLDAPPVLGGNQSWGVGEGSTARPIGSRHDGSPEVPGGLRELPLPYVAGPARAASWRERLLGPLYRQPGGHNGLTAGQMVALAIKVCLLAIGATFVFAAALLAFAAASRELHLP